MAFKLETYQCNNKTLNGILHVPVNIDNSDKKKFIIFLHGLSDYRIGPNKILVDIANSLSDIGYYCFRFDFGGRGYSTGDSEKTSHKTMLTDIDNVISCVKKDYQPDEVILLGICYGAKIAVYYSLHGRHKIDHVIELSSVQLSNDLVSRNAFLFRNTRYLIRLFFDKDHLNKTKRNLKLSKDIIKPVYHFVVKPWLKIMVIFLTDIPQLFFFKRLIRIKKNKEKTSFDGKILSIHGENDPEAEVVTKQIKLICLKYNINHTNFIILEADKYFCSIRWKEQLIQIIISWLNKIYLSNKE